MSPFGSELSTLKAQQVNRHIRVYLNSNKHKNKVVDMQCATKITQLINILEKTRTQYNMSLLVCSVPDQTEGNTDTEKAS